MKNKIKKQINELRKEITRHNRLYYTNGKPKISDAKYDKFLRELKSLEKAYPEYFSPDSPTQTVGASILEKFEKVEHTAPMLSLESVNDEEGAERFDKNCRKESEDTIEYVCEPKLDGISIELVYEKGKFVRGSTRGDGIIGEDVTLNLKTIKNVPQKLKTKTSPEFLSVRGEVMMHISDFLKLNKNQLALGKDVFANPRNVAAGSMRQLDYRITEERKLYVYCYRILNISDKMPETQKEALGLLKILGFDISPNMRHCKSIDQAIKYHHELEEKRDTLDYEIDGVVIKVNDTKVQEKFGFRTTTPKWAVAYKFKPRREITHLEDIAVQVGRTGTLTPLALLQPVEVGGVTVSRASLHNMDQINRLDVKIGDYVKVERAGDVIPYVAEVIKKKRTGKEKSFHMPSKCPSCGAKVVKEEVFYRCPSGLGCPAQVIEAIIHYSSKNAVDIEGFSEKTAKLFYELDIVKSISDIYKINEKSLTGLEGWKEKKIENLLKAIEDSKTISLDRLIFGLGIRNVGRHIAQVLAKKFGSLDNVISSEPEALEEINEIGPEIAKSITDFFKEKKNIEEIKKLINCGVKVKDAEIKEEGKLAGKKFVFTGSLSSFSRPDAQKLVEALGGEAQSSISNTTDYLVAGEKSGSKIEKARKKGINILSEEEFKKIIS